MPSNIDITYINKSMNNDLPTIFVFTKNETPTFDALKEGVAWRVMPNIGRSSSSSFVFPIETSVGATWLNGQNKTQTLESIIGKRYTVSKDDTGVVLGANGNAADTKSIDVNNDINVPNGISANLYKDGKLMMTKNIVGFGQKATFVLKPKLYWGVASEIQESQLLNSAVLNSDSFFEQDLEGVTKATISLNGNAEEGYSFKIESQE
ncbi:hypothetical protein [Pseudoalteromonas tunicata]|jgi:hypothetical protein|uniref:Uncharacterized protein n=1 Tax=Pseudoalteromonas tunicata D2 TaxID=87626 RepID=A4CA63_9GAMM|nr:hypothetical protein [Pseudoalteromonas tunicata]ATC94821.1 hypothetical protein PTUN_a2324 [Pseudoalteromonas tunicata]AXT30512.1 hypothetical protein D1819_06540 [Pseudoalteromonas tunicata]EAR28271.1 hypothetical protein PTD2_20687 [Pseudoalteromonas tunicata D2]MDP4985531.1 hypothetical protein [Pseudoalteromonas tunicata]MDP5215437.1 hypothetical protein [Pseudoalteromonas tunicata]